MNVIDQDNYDSMMKQGRRIIYRTLDSCHDLSSNKSLKLW